MKSIRHRGHMTTAWGPICEDRPKPCGFIIRNYFLSIFYEVGKTGHKNENRKMKTPVYDVEGWKSSPSCPIWESSLFWQQNNIQVETRFLRFCEIYATTQRQFWFMTRIRDAAIRRWYSLDRAIQFYPKASNYTMSTNMILNEIHQAYAEIWRWKRPYCFNHLHKTFDMFAHRNNGFSVWDETCQSISSSHLGSI